LEECPHEDVEFILPSVLLSKKKARSFKPQLQNDNMKATQLDIFSPSSSIDYVKKLISADISALSIDDKIGYINDLREFIHKHSPFKHEPVDFVKWVKNDNVVANDYNPNKVAPPEMELLEVSIMNDGYTQPIVSWSNPDKDGKIEVIDGFHRNRVGKESKLIRERVLGYLPVVDIRTEQSDKNDRIASTIRHNRARGKHQVNAMSEIVIELKNRNWSNARISKQLGMDEEEILRLCQISGLEDLFTDSDFSNAWESSDYIDNYEPISDEIEDDVMDVYRIPLEQDKSRIFHTYDKWECHKAGFYASKKEGMTNEQCESEYHRVLSDLQLFENGLIGVISEWTNSCEHYLTNTAMNRIAWLGQAAVCFLTGVPSRFCSGWSLLNDEEQRSANELALQYLNKWMNSNSRNELSMEEALSVGRQTELY
jgi:ParB-like chromosome segregation protein Spo0J